tara:strand:- start:2150 stop:3310 length:1161 start_codon:yes stop_codon:yes gene_type:complete
MKKNKILIYSGSRSDYSFLKYLIPEFKKEKIKFTLLLSGTHFSKKYGYTYKEVKNDNIKYDKLKCKFESDDFLKLNVSLSNLQIEFSKYLKKKKIDYLIILGDRIDLIPIAYASLLKGIKICHLHGGELTKYLVDDHIRHSVTKMSNYHFVSNINYKRRVNQLGENPSNIFNVGSLAIDGILKMKFLKKDELKENLKIHLDNPFFLITYQPLSMYPKLSEKEFNILLKSLISFKKFDLIFTFPNIDIGSDKIINKLFKYKKKYKNIFVFKSLGHLRYISLAKFASAIIGNSSSGIIELPFLGLPIINIGSRQDGRIKDPNIINLKKISHNKLKNNLRWVIKNEKKIFTNSFRNNFYGRGNTAKKIIKIFKKKIFKDNKYKEFFDYN